MNEKNIVLSFLGICALIILIGICLLVFSKFNYNHKINMTEELTGFDYCTYGVSHLDKSFKKEFAVNCYNFDDFDNNKDLCQFVVNIETKEILNVNQIRGDCEVKNE